MDLDCKKICYTPPLSEKFLSMCLTKATRPGRGCPSMYTLKSILKYKEYLFSY